MAAPKDPFASLKPPVPGTPRAMPIKPSPSRPPLQGYKRGGEPHGFTPIKHKGGARGR
jgi:hypothetical protein